MTLGTSNSALGHSGVHDDFEYVNAAGRAAAAPPVYTADDLRRLRRLAKGLAYALGVVVMAATVAFGWFGYLQPRLLAGTNAVQYLNACIQAQVCPTVEELNKKLAAAAGAVVAQKPVAPSAPPAAPPAK